MGSRKFSAFRMNDAAVITALRSIAKECALPPQNFSLQLGESGGHQHSVSIGDLDADPMVQALGATGSALLSHIIMSGDGYTVCVTHNKESADEVSVSFPDPPRIPDHTKALGFVAAVHRHLRGYARTAATDEVLGHEMAEFYRQREDLLRRFEALNAKLVESNEEYRLRMEAETDKLRQDLRAQNERRLEELQG